MRISTKDPADMTSEERIVEIASILARGLSRSQNNKQKQGIERSSTGLPGASKHSCSHTKTLKKTT